MTVSNSLVDVTRAMQLESMHLGSVVLARADGRLAGLVGSARQAVFPRSSVKLIQALPLIESGAADHFSFSAEELALACASHDGTEYHVAVADRLLERIGLERDALSCGCHAPFGDAALPQFWKSGGQAHAAHHNCSGKHLGMLATARHLGEPIKDYELAGHPVQRRIRAAMEEVLATDLRNVTPGIDGCSVPNWPVPLEDLAIGFARIVGGTGFEASRQAAIGRLLDACWAAPEAMGGEGRLDTTALRRFGGDVFIKTGAEGVYCGGIRSAGLGFALKVHDGAQRAAEMATRAILARFVPGAEDLGAPHVLHNAAGIAVGDMRVGGALASVLSRVEV